MSSVLPAPPLDESLYFIKNEEKEFFRSSTKIDDDEELRKHVCKLQAEAYSIFPYPCVRVFFFLNFHLCNYPAYKQVLKLGKERPDAIYLEIGCAFGTDLCKLIADGYPHENVIASDIYGEYYNLGHKLFNTTPETYPLAFIPGDIFDSSVFDPNLKRPESVTESLPPLQSLTSLIPLHSRVSVIHISSVFHLFSPEKQQKLAHILANLLSPSPGSMILGKQVATDLGIYGLKHEIGYIWHYSIPAWKELWIGDNGPFETEEVDTQVIARAVPTEVGNALGLTVQHLIWAITRV